MSLQKNKATVLNFVEQVQNQHNLDAIDELFSPNYVDHSGMSVPPTIEGTKNLMAMLFAAFPDMHMEVHMQLAEGDRVATYKSLHGTHLGPFMGIPATGKKVAFNIIDIFSVQEGRISEHWTVSDMLGLMQQLGVIPAPS